jgi:hypothetical protein
MLGDFAFSALTQTSFFGFRSHNTKKHPKKFVFFTSAGVFGLTNMPKIEKKGPEATPPGPFQ